MSPAVSINPPVPPTIDIDRLVRGRKVGVFGDLASMSREQFEDVLQSVGATPAGEKDRKPPALLVIGQRELPLDERGNLLPSLRRLFVRKRRYGAAFTALPEEQFLAALGLNSYQQQVRRLYSAATTCRSLDVTHSVLRQWVTAGLIYPAATIDGVWQFEFRQVLAAKRLSELTAAGVSTGRLRRSLERLSRWMPQARDPLQQLAVLEGRRVVVRTEAGDLAETDGQFQIEFGAQTRQTVDVSPLRLVPADIPRDAAQWRARGAEQEIAGHLQEAADSYREALLAGGPDAQTVFDLAHILSELGKKPEAAERYLQAVEIDPKFVDGWNNLGVVLSELDDHTAACQAFRRALALSPNDLRALYNLADALDERALHEEARVYWREYLRREQTSEHAAHARGRLRA